MIEIKSLIKTRHIFSKEHDKSNNTMKLQFDMYDDYDIFLQKDLSAHNSIEVNDNSYEES